MRFIYNDGGRADAGYKGSAGDCTVRAVAIATEQPYQTVYDNLFALNKINNKNPKHHSPRDGTTSMKTIKSYLVSKGFIWKATMLIGSGCKVHLKDSELPSGRIIVRVSKHLSAVVDGVINDTFDPSRDGTRCVYGYFIKGE